MIRCGPTCAAVRGGGGGGADLSCPAAESSHIQTHCYSASSETRIDLLNHLKPNRLFYIPQLSNVVNEI